MLRSASCLSRAGSGSGCCSLPRLVLLPPRPDPRHRHPLGHPSRVGRHPVGGQVSRPRSFGRGPLAKARGEGNAGWRLGAPKAAGSARPRTREEASRAGELARALTLRSRAEVPPGDGSGTKPLTSHRGLGVRPVTPASASGAGRCPRGRRKRLALLSPNAPPKPGVGGGAAPPGSSSQRLLIPHRKGQLAPRRPCPLRDPWVPPVAPAVEPVSRGTGSCHSPASLGTTELGDQS